MKGMRLKYLILILFVFIVSITACSDWSIDTEEGYQIILVEDANLLKDEKDVLFIDARSITEYKAGNIHRSINIPVEEIEEYMLEQSIDKLKVIIIFGQTITDSEEAAKILVDLGYSNVKIFGGYEDWPYDVQSNGKVLPPPMESKEIIHESSSTVMEDAELEIAYFNVFGKSSISNLVDWYMQSHENNYSFDIVVSEFRGVDDFQKRINNDDMPDIILLDKQSMDLLVSPYEWIEKGYIEDITRYFEEDSSYNDTDYFVGISEAGSVDGKRYMVPLALRTSYWLVENEAKENSRLQLIDEEASATNVLNALLNQYYDNSNWDNQISEVRYSYSMSADYGLVLYELLEQTDALDVNWTDRCVSVDDETFKSVVEYVKVQKNLASQQEVWNSNMETALSTGSFVLSNAHPTQTLFHLNSITSMNEDNFLDLIMLPSNESGNEYALSVSALGMISSDSTHKDEAFEVIRAMMDISTNDWMNLYLNSVIQDIPIRIDRNEELIDSYSLDNQDSVLIYGNSYSAIPLNLEQREKLKNYYYSVRKIYVIDSTIYNSCNNTFRLILDEETYSSSLSEILCNEIQEYISYE